MLKIGAFLSGVVLALALMAPAALAQADGGDGGSMSTSPDMGGAVASVPDLDTAPGAFIQSAYEALQHRDYRLFAALALVGVVYVARKYGAKVPGKVGAFVASDRGGALLALGLATIGGVAHALLAAQPLGLAMLGTAVYISLLAAGGYSLVKKAGVEDLMKRLLSKVGLALVLCVAIGASGCAWLRAHPRVAGALQCAEDIALEVISAVAGAFSSGSPDWGAVGRTEAAYGIDAVICAARKLTSPTMGASNPKVQAGARAYLAARGAE